MKTILPCMMNGYGGKFCAVVTYRCVVGKEWLSDPENASAASEQVQDRIGEAGDLDLETQIRRIKTWLTWNPSGQQKDVRSTEAGGSPCYPVGSRSADAQNPIGFSVGICR